METRIHPDRAAALILALASAPPMEELPLFEALGRVAAADVTARLPNPPFARSAYDGFALRSADSAPATVDAPVSLRVHGELCAGMTPAEPLLPGCAVKILTGAPLPSGADAVAPKERVRAEGDRLLLSGPLRAGENVAPAGEDVRAGDTLLLRGERLDPAALGLLAGQGLERVAVYRRPRAALICTGSELVDVGRPLSGAEIYDTNRYAVGGYLRLLGAEAWGCGPVRDDRDAVAAAIEDALTKSDAVFLTGGASVGDYDFTRAAMEKLGGRVLFWKTAMKPGGAMLAAKIGGKAVIGLSGNPGAAVMGLLRVAAPFVKRLCGLSETDWPRMRLPLYEGFGKPSPQMRLLRGRLSIDDGRACFLAAERQINGAVSSFSGCDLIAELPAGSPALPAGAPVTAYRLVF